MELSITNDFNKTEELYLELDNCNVTDESEDVINSIKIFDFEGFEVEEPFALNGDFSTQSENDDESLKGIVYGNNKKVLFFI